MIVSEKKAHTRKITTSALWAKLDRAVHGEEGYWLESVAVELYSKGIAPADIVAAIPAGLWSGFAHSLLYGVFEGVPVVEPFDFMKAAKELLGALFDAGLDVNYVEPYGGERLTQAPEQSATWLGMAAGHDAALARASKHRSPSLVRFLLRRGAHPDLDRATALHQVTKNVIELRDIETELRAASAIVSELLRAGLSTTLLTPEQVRLFFSEQNVLRLVPTAESVWIKLRLPAETRRDLRSIHAGLEAVLGRNLTRYLGEAL